MGPLDPESAEAYGIASTIQELEARVEYTEEELGKNVSAKDSDSDDTHLQPLCSIQKSDIYIYIYND